MTSKTNQPSSISDTKNHLAELIKKRAEMQVRHFYDYKIEISIK